MDEGGGAAGVAANLMRGYASRGHRVWHVVGRQRSRHPDVVTLADDDRPAYRALGYTRVQATLRRLAGRYPDRGFGAASRALRVATHPRALLHQWQGLDDFEYPGTHRLFERLGLIPDIVHLHNLHGGYFDLRALSAFSARVPTVLTLHDMWLLTGHCAHSLGCNRWQTGCGQCPDLTLAPAVRRDATDRNWRHKRDLFGRSRLFVATPSAWLRDKVAQSMLAPHAHDVRVIPNGVDTNVFRPSDRAAARRALGLPVDGAVVLLTTGSRGSMWKDDYTLRRAMEQITESSAGPPPLFVAVGRESAVRPGLRAQARSIPFQHDPVVMATYCQAADLYLHAARADTFPLAVLEALACGTPVIATAVGGIPEQIKPIALDALEAGGDALASATGMLVPAGGAAEMAAAAVALLANADARRRLGANAARDARDRFTLDHQVDAYLRWYRELIAARGSAPA